MAEDIEAMRLRHEKEILELEGACAHLELSEWMPYQPILCHTMGEVRCCNWCGQIREKSWSEEPLILTKIFPTKG